jgi:CheY-like chemotaxis protein
MILNLNVPRMTGLELLENIQKYESLKDIPAVVFSSPRLDSQRFAPNALLWELDNLSPNRTISDTWRMANERLAHLLHEVWLFAAPTSMSDAHCASSDAGCVLY